MNFTAYSDIGNTVNTLEIEVDGVSFEVLKLETDPTIYNF